MDSGFSKIGIGGAFFGWLHLLNPPARRLNFREIFCNFGPSTGFNLKKTMKDKFPNESYWRHRLTAAEHDALRPQPDLELESRLTGALAKIPDVPVPSNFTARVSNAVELEDMLASRPQNQASIWHRLWPRVAMAAAILIFAGVGIQRYETRSQRATLAKNVILIASSQPLPSVDALENLDAIQRMSQAGHADGELLAALQ